MQTRARYILVVPLIIVIIGGLFWYLQPADESLTKEWEVAGCWGAGTKIPGPLPAANDKEHCKQQCRDHAADAAKTGKTPCTHWTYAKTGGNKTCQLWNQASSPSTEDRDGFLCGEATSGCIFPNCG